MLRRRLGNTPLFLALRNVSIPSVLLVLSMLSVFGVAARHRVKQGSWRLRSTGVDGFVLLSCGICTVCALCFQWYTAEHCPVSMDQREATAELAVVLMHFLEAQHGMRWWVDFGSLLAVLRHARTMVWDPDVDFSLVAPPAPPNGAIATDSRAGAVAGARALVRRLRTYLATEVPNGAYWVDYTEQRGLIQVHHRVAHGDLWLWERDNAGNLVSNDYTTKVHARPLSLVLPLKCDARWLGEENVCVPHAAGELMRQEFGRDYMTPFVSHFECFENIWNGRLSPGIYIALALTLVPFLLGCARLYRRRGGNNDNDRGDLQKQHCTIGESRVHPYSYTQVPVHASNGDESNNMDQS